MLSDIEPLCKTTANGKSLLTLYKCYGLCHSLGSTCFPFLLSWIPVDLIDVNCFFKYRFKIVSPIYQRLTYQSREEHYFLCVFGVLSDIEPLCKTTANGKSLLTLYKCYGLCHSLGSTCFPFLLSWIPVDLIDVNCFFKYLIFYVF